MADKMFTDITFDDLTDEQKAFIDDVTGSVDFKDVFLSGCAGSGKTLLASMAAKELERQGKTAKFLTYTKFLKKYVKDHFKKRKSDLSNTIDHYHSWIYRIGKGTEPASQLAIIDECQDFTSEMIENTKANTENQIWLGDINQQIYGSTFHNVGYDIVDQDVKSSKFNLSINFRNSIAIAKLAKCFITYDKKYDKKYKNLEEKIASFILPIAHNPNQAATNRNQPNTMIQASNEQEEYDAIIEKINVIQSTDKGSKQIAVVTGHHADLGDFQNELESRGIDFERYYPLKGAKNPEPDIDFTNPNLVLLCPIHTMKGFECDYVIFMHTERDKLNVENWFHHPGNKWTPPFDLTQKEQERYIDNLLFMLFTRAKKRIICSYIDKNTSVVYQRIQDAKKDDPNYFEEQSAIDIIAGSTSLNPRKEDEIKIDVESTKSEMSEFEKHFPFKDDEPLEDEPQEIDEEDDLPF